MSDLRRGTPRAEQPLSSVEGYQEEGKQLYFLILMRLQERGWEDKAEYQELRT